MSQTHFTRILALTLVVLLSVLPAMANVQYVIGVKGLSCPFCAYGLEKKLKKVKNVQSVEIFMNKGEALVTAKEGQSIDEDELHRAVKKAGFTVSFIKKVTSEKEHPRGIQQ